MLLQLPGVCCFLLMSSIPLYGYTTICSSIQMLIDMWVFPNFGVLKVQLLALSTIARTWKQPRCPSADEWIRKLWYAHTVEYYSAIKQNAFESVLMRWMKLEPIIQREVTQKEKHQYSMLTHIYGI